VLDSPAPGLTDQPSRERQSTRGQITRHTAIDVVHVAKSVTVEALRTPSRWGHAKSSFSGIFAGGTFGHVPASAVKGLSEFLAVAVGRLLNREDPPASGAERRLIPISHRFVLPE
jgi:hypothetical protein